MGEQYNRELWVELIKPAIAQTSSPNPVLKNYCLCLVSIVGSMWALAHAVMQSLPVLVDLKYVSCSISVRYWRTSEGILVQYNSCL
jgi:hypothetical protein